MSRPPPSPEALLIARFNEVPQIIFGPGDEIVIDLSSIPTSPPVPVQPGDTWHFQCWYRDVNPASTNNFTNGLTVTFE